MGAAGAYGEGGRRGSPCGDMPPHRSVLSWPLWSCGGPAADFQPRGREDPYVSGVKGRTLTATLDIAGDPSRGRERKNAGQF